eukprot:4758589-Amphidinium_carterae.1
MDIEYCKIDVSTARLSKLALLSRIIALAAASKADPNKGQNAPITLVVLNEFHCLLLRPGAMYHYNANTTNSGSDPRLHAEKRTLHTNTLHKRSRPLFAAKCRIDLTQARAV